MLRTLVIGAAPELAQKLESAFFEAGRFGLLRAIERYPSQSELERLVRAHAPQVVFICLDGLQEAIAVKHGLETTVPGVPVVAFGYNAGQQALLELMKAGVREVVPAPFNAHELMDLAVRIDQHLAKNPLSFDATDMMFTFLPAKPGVGASTIALNLSVAMSAQPEGRALLADFDLNSGLIAFMLKMSSPYSVVDAVMRCEELDENLWPQLVYKLDRLHILPSGRTEPGVRVQPMQIHRMLEFARRHYDVICADLSGNLEKYSIELMEESKRIFVVTTPEIPPLHLARERITLLRNLDIGDRVTVLLNRWQKRNAISVAQIEDLLEAPVYETFPNNYTGVHAALVAGRPIDSKSDLGKRFAALAQRILNAQDARPARPKRSFLETFSILPAKFPALK